MQAKNTYDRSAILAGYIPSGSFKQNAPAIPEHEDWGDDLDDDDNQELGDHTPQVSSSNKHVTNSQSVLIIVSPEVLLIGWPAAPT